MTDTPSLSGIAPITCPACGARMNPHAEKPAAPTDASEAARADWTLGGIVEEVHQCPGCGRVKSRRVV